MRKVHDLPNRLKRLQREHHLERPRFFLRLADVPSPTRTRRTWLSSGRGVRSFRRLHRRFS